MAIPAESAFDECLSKIDSYPLSESEFEGNGYHHGWERANFEGLWVDKNYQHFRSKNREACEEALGFVEDKLSARRKEIFGGVVMQWLLASSEYQRVYAKLFPLGFKVRSEREAKKLREEFVEWAFRRLCKAASLEGEGRLRSISANYLYEREKIFGDQKDDFRWLRALISAIREYHYDNTAEEMAERKRTYQNRIQRTIDGVRCLRSLVSDEIAMEVARVMCDGRDIFVRFKGSRFDEEKIVQCLDDMMKIDPDALYPISRLDSTARARVFVYRMAEANWREFRSHKPAQIADLMYLDGFDVQLDQRTIQRQCKSLTSMDKIYWTQVQKTASGAAYMERLRQWRQLINKNR
ncbi:hypothetical protein [Burkholderia cenocepacia]|uniref:hypothetical protein n=1 Tax=Burkholderia cenocepacia TaxID=95486 RepID=UPI001B991E96|nr:hypothetical protein [Burkholderia cenocepacia]MBR7969077.1 hypothetical protein [Burkholderia cenocepacia]